MVRKILKYPEDKETLMQKSKEVKIEEIKSEFIQNLITDIIDTVKDSGGAGLSAIQLGFPLRICAINWDGIHILINPVVTRSRGQHKMQEGCLSVPGIFIEGIRAQKVWISAYNENGDAIEYAEGGNGSFIVQHELDHFEGMCPLFMAYEQMKGENENNEIQEKQE